jgi:hypothetical protein
LRNANRDTAGAPEPTLSAAAAAHRRTHTDRNRASRNYVAEAHAIAADMCGRPDTERVVVRPSGERAMSM